MTAVLDEQLLERLRAEGDQPEPLFHTLDARTCEACGSTFRRSSRVSRAVFAERRTCGRSCALKLRRGVLRGETAPKSCEQCRGEYRRPPAMGRAEWARRRFCSRTCSEAARLPGPADRACKVCSEPIPRRNHGQAMYDQRRYCSRRCVGLARQKPPGAEPARRSSAPREAKTCAHCEATFERPVGVARAAFAARRCCSRSCAALLRAAGRPKPAPKTLRKPAARKPRPKLKPVPVFTGPPTAAVWRPAGFASEVQVFGAGRW